MQWLVSMFDRFMFSAERKDVGGSHVMATFPTRWLLSVLLLNLTKCFILGRKFANRHVKYSSSSMYALHSSLRLFSACTCSSICIITNNYNIIDWIIYLLYQIKSIQNIQPVVKKICGKMLFQFWPKFCSNALCWCMQITCQTVIYFICLVIVYSVS